MRCSKQTQTTVRAAALLIVTGCGLLLCAAIQNPTDSSASPQTPVQQPAEPPAQSQPPAETHVHAQPEFLVVIDPSHGGDDAGAALGDKITEKDITLAVARRLKAELQERGIAAHLLRDGDTTIDLEQRAQTANEKRAAIYFAIHAGTPGGGVRVYAPALSSLPPDNSKFLPWEDVQAPYLPRSRTLARAVAAELEKKGLQALSLSTSLRPLNNINAPAIAIEIASDRDSIQQVLGQKLQTTVAAAIASVAAQFRPQWERAQ
jgi:N-acetylmuramoyl-L-alanine amidase